MRTSIYERPPYLKAKRRLQRYTDRWFYADIGTMVAAGLSAVIGMLSCRWSVLAVGVMCLLLGNLVCRRRWEDGSRRMLLLVETAHRIWVGQIEQEREKSE